MNPFGRELALPGMHNVGTLDRIARAVIGIAVIVGAVVAPIPTAFRLFGGFGVALLWTALAGTCPGYKLLGVSSCRSH